MILERSLDPGWLSNAYLVADRDGGTAVIVDSGAPLRPLFQAIERHRLKVAAILTTHRHLDHIQGHAELRRRTGAPVYALAPETPHVPSALAQRHRLKVAAILTTHRHLDHIQGHAELIRRTGAPVYALAPETPHVPSALALEPEGESSWGGLTVRVVPLPGHTAGHSG